MKLQRKSSNYFDIIRMEREGVEKAGVAGLMSGVKKWRSGGKRKILRKEGGARRWRKSQNPHAPTRSGHAAHKSWPLAKGLPPQYWSMRHEVFEKMQHRIETTLLDIPARLF